MTRSASVSEVYRHYTGTTSASVSEVYPYRKYIGSRYTGSISEVYRKYIGSASDYIGTIPASVSVLHRHYIGTIPASSVSE